MRRVVLAFSAAVLAGCLSFDQFVCDGGVCSDGGAATGGGASGGGGAATGGGATTDGGAAGGGGAATGGGATGGGTATGGGRSDKFGDACASDAECAHPSYPGRELCKTEFDDGGATGFVGGMCSAICTSPTDCGDAGVCVLFGADADAGRCLRQCGDTNACRLGYVCEPAGVFLPAPICWPSCVGNPTVQQQCSLLGRTCGDAGTCS